MPRSGRLGRRAAGVVMRGREREPRTPLRVTADGFVPDPLMAAVSSPRSRALSSSSAQES